MRTHLILPLVALLALPACDGPRPARAADTAGAPSTFTPDSVRGRQLEQFRAGLPAAAGLDGGAASRDALIEAFLTALQARDTAALRGLALTRAEFAWLYYPTAQQALPPYDLDPETFWFTLHSQGAKGYGRLLERFGGQRMGYTGYRCDGEPRQEGRNTLYGPCVIRAEQAPGDTVEGRLFGLVIEREGRWKFVSYANKLD